MDLLQTAWILLTLRVISVAIILYIIFKITFPNLKAENDQHVKPVRWVLFFISIALLVGNIIPITFDTLALVGPTPGVASVLSSESIVYTFNNAISHFVYSLGFLFLFLTSGQVNAQLKRSNVKLQDENDDLHREANS